MFDPYRVLGPLVRCLDPEDAHQVALRALTLGTVPFRGRPADPRLAQTVWGLHFVNPVGLAAGFDKNAQAVAPLLRLGFGFVEAGTVTPRPQPGNPRPRVFRLPAQKAMINRYGFNNDGLEAVSARFVALRRSGTPAGPVGANIGKNKDSTDAVADYVTGVQRLAPLADYLVINVSSPNTPGLRTLQDRAPLTALLQAAVTARAEACTQASLQTPPPLLLKIAPDLTDDDLETIAEVTLASGIDGLIVSNTTITRPGLQGEAVAAEPGGLSGPPLLALSTATLFTLYRLTEGRLPLIGSGGISSAADAYAKIRAGASLVQLYTALVYAGPGLIAEICRGLVRLLDRDGFSALAQAVGAAHR